MKAAPADDLKSEIDAMMRVPHHPNVIHPLVGVGSAGNGHIDKFLIPSIEGKQLARMRAATVDQKDKWKAQLSDAVSSLHKAGLSWGVVAPMNVMIDKKTAEAVLIDLAFSHFDGNDGLEGTVVESEEKKDLQALEHLLRLLIRSHALRSTVLYNTRHLNI